jgi:hypothetical protein
MSEEPLRVFLSCDVNDAFEFARRLARSSNGPSEQFLSELNNALGLLANNKLSEGNPEWAHVVAGLMIAYDWRPDTFAAVAASLLASEDGAVWTAAARVLSHVSRLDQATFDSIGASAKKSPFSQVAPGSATALLDRLRDRIVAS